MGAVPPPPHDRTKSLDENLRILREWSDRRFRFYISAYIAMFGSLFVLIIVVALSIVVKQ